MIAVVTSVASSDSIVAEANKHYPWIVFETADLVLVSMNHTYVLTGSDGRTYYLRVSPPSKSVEILKFERSVLDALRRADFLCSPPLRDVSGNTYFQLEYPEGIRFASLFEEQVGEDPNCNTIDKAFATMYGSAVEQLYDCADRLMPSPQPHYTMRISDRYSTLCQRLVVALGARRKEHIGFFKLLEGINEQITISESYEPKLCHGDLNGRNAKIRNGAAHLIDFDLIHFGERIYDLSVFSATFVYRRDPHERIAELSAAYLKAVPKHAPLDRVQLDLFNACIALRILWLLDLRLAQTSYLGFESLSDDAIRDFLVTTQDWIERGSSLLKDALL